MNRVWNGVCSASWVQLKVERKSSGSGLADKRRLLGQYSSLADSAHGVCCLFVCLRFCTLSNIYYSEMTCYINWICFLPQLGRWRNTYWVGFWNSYKLSTDLHATLEFHLKTETDWVPKTCSLKNTGQWTKVQKLVNLK
jgi:hypothetical protein